MADRSSTPDTPRHPSSTALAILITVSLLAILGLGWIWFTRYAPVHFETGPDATLTDARNAAYIIPLVLFGVFLIALMWLLTWILARWQITALPLVIGVFGVISLVFAGRELWMSANASQPIVVGSYLCDADAARIAGRSDRIPTGCDPAKDVTTEGVSIGTSGEPGMLSSDDASDSGDLIGFSDLPHGTYDALLTTSAPSDTTAAILIAETDDGIRAVSRLERVEGDTWSGEIALHPNLETYGVLMYASPYTSAPDATIRITVQQCTGTSLATFDASSCEPVTPTSPIVQEVLPPDETDRGRPIDVSIEDGVITLTNLEEREYTFRPGDPNTDILVIPTDDPQTTDNNVLSVDAASPQGTFTLGIETRSNGNDGASFTIYLFDRAPTVATIDAPHEAAMASGVRP